MNDTDGGNELPEVIKTEPVFWDFRRLIAFVLILIPIATVFGNTLVIVAVFRERSLHNVTNQLIVSLAFADFLIALCVMSFAVYFEINSYVWGLGPFLCNLYMATDVALSTASILNLLAISIDRYTAVAQPFMYAELATKWKRPKIMIFTVWITSGTVGLPILLGVNSHADDQCEFTNALFIIISSLLSFFLPCTAIIVLYTVILCRLHQRQKGKQWRYNSQQPAPSDICSALVENARLAEQFGKHFKSDQFYFESSTQMPSPLPSPSDDDQSTETVTVPVVELHLAYSGHIITKREPKGNEQQQQQDEWNRSEHPSFGEHLHDLLPYIDSPSEQLSPSCKLHWNDTEQSFFEDTKTEETWLESKCSSAFIPQNTSHSERVCDKTLIDGIANGQNVESMRDGRSIYREQSRGQIIRRALRKLRRERKATITLAVVLGVFLFCWLPFFTLHTINAICIFHIADNCVHFDAFFFTTWLGYFNSSLNPLIYTVFDKRFRRAFRRILPFDAGKS